MKTIEQNKKYKLDELPIDASRFKLKALRVWEGREGGGFECNLFIDGVCIARAYNSADGGETTIDYLSVEREEIAKEIEESLKDYPWLIFSPDADDFAPWDIEAIINVLIDLENERKWIKKETLKFILYRTPKTEEGGWTGQKRKFKVSHKWCAREEEDIFKLIQKQCPDVTEIVGFRTRKDWKA